MDKCFGDGITASQQLYVHRLASEVNLEVLFAQFASFACVNLSAYDGNGKKSCLPSWGDGLFNEPGSAAQLRQHFAGAEASSLQF